MTDPSAAFGDTVGSAPGSADAARLHILHEHPDWFRPLFAELDRRGIPFVRIDARAGATAPAEPGRAPDRVPTWDPAALPAGAVLFNRMSPSAWQRGAADAVLRTADLLARAEAAGARVINGSEAWAVEISKARQLELLEEVGVHAPRSRVVRSPEVAVEAARDLELPVVTKPDVGGSGAGVTPFATHAALRRAAAEGRIDLGITGVGLVQERFRSEDGAIHRVEVLGGRVLYGIRVHAPEDEFNLCPADACRTAEGAELTRAACAVDAADQGLRVEAFEPSAEIVDEVERIARAAGIEVGGIEYVIEAGSGVRLYYDVNALSNFVADGPRVVGLDPFARLVDWLEEVLAETEAEIGRGAAPGGVR
jgi:glutathione synthase/RimK-type ligase-like ATP-grasp enzyme